MISREMATTRSPLRVLAVAIITLCFYAIIAAAPCLAAASSDEEAESSTSSGTGSGNGMDVSLSEAYARIADGKSGAASPNKTAPKPPSYRYIWTPVSEFAGCGAVLDGGSWSCAPHPDSCEAGTGSRFAGEGDALRIGSVSNTSVEGVTQRGTRINNETGERTDLGVRCALPGTPEYEEAPPVVIVVTREDFARLLVKPLEPHAGPAEGWLPVNMVNVLYTEPDTQLLTTELLDTPAAIRATPVSYHWDLGDGNTITTTNPGQFSVDGGEWQDIDGTIGVTSDPVPIYSESLESRLVNGDVPVDEDEDPWIPERTADTEGPRDPNARHREI